MTPHAIGRALVRLMLCVIVATAASWTPFAQAQDTAWPTHAITVVVPFPSGGPADIVARVVAQKLGESLGQAVIVENRAGAGGNIGAGAVARAAPDGYTLLLGVASLITSPHMFKQLGFDPLKDLTPIAMMATAPVFVWVDSRFPAQTLAELVTTAKNRPGQLNYSSSAPATLAHLGSLLFFERAGVQLMHLSYKGSAQATNDLLGGVFPIHFDVAQPLVPHMKTGRVRPLAVLASRRSPLMPEVPSVAELGYPSIDAVPFMSLLAPAATPKAIVTLLNTRVRAALQAPDVRAKLGALYFEVADGGQPEALAAWMREQSRQWGTVIRQHDLKVE